VSRRGKSSAVRELLAAVRRGQPFFPAVVDPLSAHFCSIPHDHRPAALTPARDRVAGALEAAHTEGVVEHETESPFPDPIVLPIEDALDLHPFAPRDVASVVDAYLEEAARAGFREVRLVHGKGMGVQRERVRAVLARHPLVERFAEAPTERGGWGATLVWLRARA
jgi:hypothetical protein